MQVNCYSITLIHSYSDKAPLNHHNVSDFAPALGLCYLFEILNVFEHI
jgi:hypothetical protein